MTIVFDITGDLSVQVVTFEDRVELSILKSQFSGWVTHQESCLIEEAMGVHLMRESATRWW